MPTPTAGALLQLRIALRELEPPITRLVQVPASFTFRQLHEIIQAVMPWMSSHLHMFETPGGGQLSTADLEDLEDLGSDEHVRLSEHLRAAGDEVLYLYDFGDHWEHHITVEAVLPPEPEDSSPRLLAGERAAPPEDCGGFPGYQEILDSLASGARDPELLAWLPRRFNPERFDLAGAQRRLARAFPPPKKPPQSPPPTPSTLPGDEVPLTEAELKAALRSGSFSALSPLRWAAAVLDVAQTALPHAELAARLHAAADRSPPLAAPASPTWRRGLVTVREGALTLDPEHPDLRAVRRIVRQRAAPVFEQEARQAKFRAEQAASAPQREEEERRRREEARSCRRAILVALPDAARPRAVGLLDLRDLSIQTWADERLSEVPAALARYDVLAAPFAETLWGALGLDPARWSIADLKPAQRTMRRDGHLVHVTPELVLTSTLGIRRPLPDAAAVEAALTRGDGPALTRLLGAALRVYYALYTYGVLHNFVLVTHGRNLELMPVRWGLPGDMNLWQILGEAEQSGRPVEFVTGQPPPGLDLFANAGRGKVVAREMWTITLLEDRALVEVPRERFLAARLA